MNITEIIPRNNFVLHVKTDKGEEGFFDVKPYIKSEAFAPLKDQKEFKRIHNGSDFVEWECGADLSADTIEARWVNVSDRVV